MAKHYETAALQELTDWAQQAAETLELEPLEERDVRIVLSEAAQASAALVRPAGPVAMYLAGLVFATERAADVRAACRIVDRLLHDPGLSGGANETEHRPQRIRD